MKDDTLYSFQFVDGAITQQMSASVLQKGSDNLSTGAYSVFLGQVRADSINHQTVTAIDYSANRQLSEKIMLNIMQDATTKYSLNSVVVLHSLGIIHAGEICLLVMVTCGHRKESFDACEYIVERLKKELPVWGKEILSNETHTWKVNK